MSAIEIYWDVVSPYTYLALTQLPALAERHGVEIIYRPFLLGGVMKATGNQPPGTLPAKAAFMLKDLARWARLYDVPMKMPVVDIPFPINTVSAMRMAVVAGRQGKAAEAAAALSQAYWRQGQDVSDPAALAAVARTMGLDPAAVAEQIQDPSIKEELRTTTAEAVAKGAFGAPTMIVNGELYWGNDRLDHVERAVRGER